MYRFDGVRRAACTTLFHAALDAAAAGGPYAMAQVQDALVALIGRHVAIASAPGDAEDTGDVPGIASALDARSTLIRGFVMLVADEAEESAEPDRYRLAIVRSAVELAREAFPSADVADPDDLARLDAVLRATSGRPLLGDVPPAMPASHWWWSA